MGFLIPAFFGLSIFLVGLVLFYMFRKQYEEHIVSSNVLWTQVMNEWQATKWWKKLQRQLLLLLQLLILLFLMLALVRPFIHTDGVEGEHVIVLLDQSATMSVAMNEANENRFEEAKKEIIALLDKKNNNQAVSVIGVGDSPSLYVNRETDRTIIESRIKEIDINYESSDFTRALSLAQSLSEGQSSSVHVFTDSLTSEDVNSFRFDAPFYVNNMSSELDDNVAIVTFGLTNKQNQTSAIVTLQNESEGTQTVMVLFKADGNIVQELEVSLVAKEVKYVTVDSLPSALYYEASIENEDMYVLDNSAFAFSSSEQKPVVYTVGSISSFLNKILLHLGYDVMQAETFEDINDLPKDSIIISSIGRDEELSRTHSMLLLASEKTEKVSLEEAITTKVNEELFDYVTVQDIYISQAIEIDSVSAETVMSSGNIPLINKGIKDGQAYVELFFSIQDSDWPMHSSFPIFIYHVMEFLQGETGHIGYFQPNEARVIQVSSTEPYEIVDDMGNKKGTHTNTSELFQAPAKPGLYALKSQQEETLYFAVTVADSERSVWSADSFVVGADVDKSITDSTRFEWWPWLVLVAFILLLVEWEVYRRGIRT